MNLKQMYADAMGLASIHVKQKCHAFVPRLQTLLFVT